MPFIIYSFAGDYLVDLGGAWVHGEVGNVAFELAWPLGLLQRSADLGRDTWTYDSSGVRIDEIMTENLIALYENYSTNESGGTGSVGDAIEKKYGSDLRFKFITCADQKEWISTFNSDFMKIKFHASLGLTTISRIIQRSYQARKSTCISWNLW